MLVGASSPVKLHPLCWEAPNLMFDLQLQDQSLGLQPNIKDGAVSFKNPVASCKLARS